MTENYRFLKRTPKVKGKVLSHAVVMQKGVYRRKDWGKTVQSSSATLRLLGHHSVPDGQKTPCCLLTKLYPLLQVIGSKVRSHVTRTHWA